MNANKQDAGGFPPGEANCPPHDEEIVVTSKNYEAGFLEGMKFCQTHFHDGEQCRAASGDGELRETAEQNWLFIEHVTNWIIGRGLLEVTHEGGSLEAAKNITDSLDRAISRGVPVPQSMLLEWQTLIDVEPSRVQCEIAAAIAAQRKEGEDNG